MRLNKVSDYTALSVSVLSGLATDLGYLFVRLLFGENSLICLAGNRLFLSATSHSKTTKNVMKRLLLKIKDIQPSS